MTKRLNCPRVSHTKAGVGLDGVASQVPQLRLGDGRRQHADEREVTMSSEQDALEEQQQTHEA